MINEPRRPVRRRLVLVGIVALAVWSVGGPATSPGFANPAQAADPEPTTATRPRPVGSGPIPAPQPTPTPRGGGSNAAIDGLPPFGLRPALPAAGATTRPVGVRPPRPPLPGRCRIDDAIARANGLLEGKFRLSAYPPVFVGLDPTWAEDPFNDRNWQFMHNSLSQVLALLEAWVTTGDRRYYDRAEFLLFDWYRDNPRVGAPSIWAWNDHSTAIRAAVYACAAPYFPGRAWMIAALDLHGRTLADPKFYVNQGNHALNQSIGLLEVGVVRGRDDWEELAADRINVLIKSSIDSQGVTNEQSAGYQSYNLSRYLLAQERLTDLSLPVGPEFSRVPLMTNFLAYATLPNGKLEQLGDTDYGGAQPWPGTWAEFAATMGVSGPKPPRTYAVFNAGYVLARSGWGETRPFADEVFTSMRFGPAPLIHGHADGTSVTFYGYGSRLLVDPGKYNYNADPYRAFMKGRSAHNVVTVDGAKWSSTATTKLVRHAETAAMIDATMSTSGYAGVTQQRHVTFSRSLNYLLVEDRATATTARTFRQLWHLDDTAAPVVSTNSFRTTHQRGNVLVRQLIPAASSRTIKGATAPVQGWVSYVHGSKLAASVIEVVKTGTSARYLTLIVPAAGTPTVTVTRLFISATGYAVTITIGAHSERVTVSGATTTVTTLR